MERAKMGGRNFAIPSRGSGFEVVECIERGRGVDAVLFGMGNYFLSATDAYEKESALRAVLKSDGKHRSIEELGVYLESLKEEYRRNARHFPEQGLVWTMQLTTVDRIIKEFIKR